MGNNACFCDWFSPKIISYQIDSEEHQNIKSYFSIITNKRVSYFNELKNSPYNMKIAIEKKHFNKLITVRTKFQPNSKIKKVHWWDFIINYFLKQLNQGTFWYRDILDKIESLSFTNETQYQSWLFFDDFEKATIPECLINQNKEINLATNVHIEDETSLRSDSEQVEETLLNKLTSIPYMRGNSINNNQSKINLSGVTECWGGSVASYRDRSIIAGDPDYNYNNIRGRIKEIVKIFKRHWLEREHPIRVIVDIFGDQIAHVIHEKIIELNEMKDENEDTYKENIKLISEGVVYHIQKFIWKIQSTFKLFYIDSVDLKCFFEEKDEMINLITSVLFNSSSWYGEIYRLFSIQLGDNVNDLKWKLEKSKELSPEEWSVPVKFCWDEVTLKYQQELKSQYESNPLKNKVGRMNNLFNDNIMEGDREEFHSFQGDNYSDNNVDDENIVLTRTRWTVSTTKRVQLGKGFRSKNIINGYETVFRIMHSWKTNKVPFEKMMLIASWSTEITECVNKFWDGMETFIPPTLLNINADELMTIFIYWLVKANMPEIIIHQKIIQEFTTKTTKSTMIGYYNTTWEAAVEYIQKEFGEDHNQI